MLDSSDNNCQEMTLLGSGISMAQWRIYGFHFTSVLVAQRVLKGGMTELFKSVGNSNLFSGVYIIYS